RRGRSEIPVALAIRTELAGPLSLMAWPLPGGDGRSLLKIGGSVHDVVLLWLHLVLTRESTARIRRCPEAPCGHRMFVRSRRQLYCSGQCADRANKRAARATPAGREREALRQRRRYDREIRKQHPRARIKARRPRK